MRVANHYAFDSCLRKFYEGYRLFLHLNHRCKGLAI
jgi:hypothetical protein